MNEGLIRVRDFAERCGCTPQNVYLHLQNYATELEGHIIQGRGRQGRLLDGYAQDFLRSVMYPKELGDGPVARENEKLRTAVALAAQENAALLKRALDAENERDRALLREGENQRLLVAAEEIQIAQAAELEQAKLDIREARSEAGAARHEADQLHLELERERTARQAAEAHNAALKNRGLWARITRKGE